MALQPSSRPDGSTTVLRFTGTITLANVTAANYPKLNGEVPSNIAANVYTGVRFLLADATALTDLTKQFPRSVFDDAQLAGVSPHAAVAAGGVAGPITNPTDLLINNRTWCQNTSVSVTRRGNAASVAALTAFDLPGIQWCLDGVNSGLGTNTGLPVMILPILSPNAAAGWVAPDVDIIIRINHTAIR